MTCVVDDVKIIYAKSTFSTHNIQYNITIILKPTNNVITFTRTNYCSFCFIKRSSKIASTTEITL